MIAVKRFVPTLLILGSVCAGAALASDWPGFRGAKGGVADDNDLPVKWTKDNFLFKVKLPGAGTSSPIIHGDKLVLTCYTGYGQNINKAGFGGGFGKGGFGKGGADSGGDQKKLKLVVMCFDRLKGEVIWQKEIAPKLPEQSFSNFLRDHGYASSTPITDGERVYVFFGKTGVLAFDMTGKQLWQTDVGSKTHMWGSAASPILYKDLVIVNAAIESGALVAIDKKSGKEVWRTGGVGTSWASPVLVDAPDGKQEVVVSQPGKIVAYDPAKGDKLWNCQGIGGGSGKGFGGGKAGGFPGMGGGYTCSTPVTRDGVAYIIGGGGPTSPTALAVKAGGRGDVNKSHVLWRKGVGAAMASPVLVGENLCWVNGVLTAVKIADGATAFRERLYDGTNEYNSAVVAGDKIFALTRLDGLYVTDAKGKKLAHHSFDGDNSVFNASPAIAGGRIYLRSNAYLYCVGNK
jgi:outer membrane protein assembly factor BamB